MATSTSAFAAGERALCILEKLPGAQNNQIAEQLLAQCGRKYPGGYRTDESDYVGQRWGFLGYKDGASCVLAKAKDTVSPMAAQAIKVACYRLYEPILLSLPPGNDCAPGKSAFECLGVQPPSR